MDRISALSENRGKPRLTRRSIDWRPNYVRCKPDTLLSPVRNLVFLRKPEYARDGLRVVDLAIHDEFNSFADGHELERDHLVLFRRRFALDQVASQKH